MTILEILSKAANIPVKALEGIIAAGAVAAPDFKPEADRLIAWLDQNASAENLVALGKVIFSESNDIAHGNIKPSDHPSDAI
jgi:hypothetical protein